MRCPGQDTRYWKEDAIFEEACPFCGTEIEFFKDDTARTCPGCGRRVPNPRMDFSCAAYCKYAEQCLGSLPPELLAQRGELLKERLGLALKGILGPDFERLEKILSLVQQVEALLRVEKESPGLALMAAYLFHLSEEERATALEKANVPEVLKEELRRFLAGIPENPRPEDFLKEETHGQDNA
ncbi:phosphohydrolase [Thermosulfurimonas marina]|uniref:Phosphohydrolase n=1 Tax=Thermosulfurimonas marina TaxID=2047767 RepID=A0A6H1WSX4_9BACT|nr:phosphohydrolase [Thermosulfurimonas marina]QJA06226.1 phosphohydrolase [Thermosulfurimonas marina]